MALPTMRWGYLWDDFQFLARGHHPLAGTLLPDPGLLLYRPLSREIYFSLLAGLGPLGPAVAHGLQALILAAAVLLLVRIASRLAGAQAGVAAGLVFACLYPTPLLVGWISAAQDLFAIFFFLGAVELHLTDRRWLAAAAYAASLLSKETALGFLPALVLLDWAQGRSSGRGLLRETARYGAVTVLWLAFHPGIRYLATHGLFAGSDAGYVTLSGTGRLGSAARTLLSLVNIPFHPSFAPLTAGRAAAFAAALLPFGFAVWGALIRRPDPAAPSRGRDRRPVLAYGAVVALPTLVLSSFLVGHWAPYYACVPAVGSAVALGVLLATARSRRFAVLIAAALLGLGMLCRTMNLDPRTPNEQGLESVDRELRHTRAGFLRVCPTMPPGATAYVSVGATGQRGIYTHIHELQVLRVWYGDPTLVTLRPERRRAGTGPEFLFRVPADGSVIRIDPLTREVWSSKPRFEEGEVLAAVRNYALGLAGSGDVDRAVRFLDETLTADPLDRNWNARLAALLLLSSGHTEEGRRRLKPLAPLPDDVALASLFGTLTVPIAGLPLEDHVMEAFGFAPSDTSVLRVAMREAVRLGYSGMALGLARRMQSLAPGDPESRALIERSGRIRAVPRPVPPIAVDSL